MKGAEFVNLNFHEFFTADCKQLNSATGEERLRKRPRMPAGLSADQKAKNREIVKRMQMKAWVFSFGLGDVIPD